MNMPQINQLPASIGNFKSESPTQLEPQKQDGLPFASMVQDVIQNIDSQQQTVATDVARIASGEADNLQAIAANVAKADLSFRFLMEMRDKLITSYQEIMRMQV